MQFAIFSRFLQLIQQNFDVELLFVDNTFLLDIIF